MAVRESLLALLSDEPKHGYQLKAEYDASVAGDRALNIGQVYTTLDRLERDGLVTPVDGDGDNGAPAAGSGGSDGRRKRYGLTAPGEAAIAEWFATAVAPAAGPARDELTSKVVLALRARSVDELAVVRTERAALVARLQTLRRGARPGRPSEPKARPERPSERGARPPRQDDLGRRLLADAAAARLEAEVSWLDRCEEEMRRRRVRREVER